MTAGPAPIDKVRKTYDYFSSGDFDGFMTIFTDKSTLDEPTALPYGGMFHGHDAIRASIQTMMSHWSSIRFDVTQLVDGGDTVVGIGNYTAVAKLSGIEVNFRIVEFWDFNADGDLVQLRVIYGDTKQTVDALNAVPA